MPSPPGGEPTQDGEVRDTQRQGSVSRYPEHVDRWAIIVGISEYQHEDWNLKYARADAEALYELIQQPSHGGFPRDNILPLFDEDATTRRIQIGLRSFLQDALEEDLVLIYFACHGAPDPNRVDNLYLLTHDTERDAIAGTALPMWELTLSLDKNLRAERGVILVDACHSAGATLGLRGEGDTAGALNQLLHSLSQSQKGLAWLTSAEANQVSREGAEWGGGHGVFTHYLLEGLRGAADTQPHDGIVTVGELFEYVQEKVKEATSHQQHPAPGPTPFDRELPMAIIGGLQAQEHYQLGRHLYDLGWSLDDRGRFASAARQFSEAVRLGRHFPQAYLELGRSLLAQGEPEQAVRALQRALKQDKDLTEAHFHLGIAYVRLRENENAVQAFQSFLAHHPDDDRAPWVEALRDALAGPPGNRYALLIGIEYAHLARRLQMQGPSHDVQMMRDLLRERFQFPTTNITQLVNENATRAGILAALDALRQKAGPRDTVLIYFSGHSNQVDSPNYLAPHDYGQGAGGDGGSWISAEELHGGVSAISAGSTTLALDTGANHRFINLARDGASYTLFLAASPDSTAYEYTIEVGEGETRRAGLFTWAFAQQLRQLPDDASCGELLNRVLQQVGETEVGGRQTPLFIGDEHAPPLFFGHLHRFLMPFELSQRRNFAALTLDQVQRRYDGLDPELDALVPGLYGSYGRAFLEKGAYLQALQALQAAAEGGSSDPGDLFALGLAQLRTGHCQEALGTFQRYGDAAPAHADLTGEAVGLITDLGQDRRHALLVGIDAYQAEGLPRPRGAANDVRALQQVLVESCGFLEGDVKPLVDEEATRAAIISAFGELVKVARQAPALFLFAGNGSLTPDGRPTVVPVDGRQGAISDIELRELVGLVGEMPTNLVTVIDAGWAIQDPPGPKWRAAPVDTRPPTYTRLLRPAKATTENWTETREAVLPALQSLRIGRGSIYQVSIHEAFSGEHGRDVARDVEVTSGVEAMVRPADASQDFRRGGQLTQSLAASLHEAGSEPLTYAQLAHALRDRLDLKAPFIVAKNMYDHVIGNHVLLDRVQDLLQRRIEQQPLREAIQILRRLIEQRNGIDPEGHANLGIALAALGEYEQALAALKTAYDQQEGPDLLGAHYHRGRILVENDGEPIDAVRELRAAAKEQPGDPLGGYYQRRAHYYLGRALRIQAERDILAEAERAFGAYLDSGAPLGHRDEVRTFLRTRREQGQTR